MLNTDRIYDYLKNKKKKETFENIWKNIKKELSNEFNFNEENSEIDFKTDLYISMLRDKRFVFFVQQKAKPKKSTKKPDNVQYWTLSENYTLTELEDMNNNIFEITTESDVLFEKDLETEESIDYWNSDDNSEEF